MLPIRCLAMVQPAARRWAAASYVVALPLRFIAPLVVLRVRGRLVVVGADAHCHPGEEEA